MPGRKHLWRGIHDKEMTARAVTLGVVVPRGKKAVPGRAVARISLTNTGAGHMFPTYMIPAVFIKVELLDENRKTVEGSRRVDRIQRRLLVILGSNALKTAVVALLMLLLFRSLVTRHLDDLASYLDTDQVGGPSRPLALDRPPDDTDEIGRTVVAVNAMVARSTDQFERTHAQREEIERLNVGLVARLEEMQSFSYSLAHDLSGPLRTAHSFAEIVHEDIDDADQQDLLMRIQSACQRMNDLIAGMSTVGDTRLLQTAVESLLRNAWTFTASRPEAVVEVGYGEVAGREGFYVRDNGIGFDPEHSARIFSPFERLHPESAGSGVGLAVVRTVVARHGGEVWAEARPDEGATFAFSIGHLDTGIHQVVSSG